MGKALFAVLATVAVFAATAAAATAGGTLTGSASFGPVTISSDPGNPVHDGGASSGLKNDTSGNCTGDTGQIDATIFGIGPVTAAVVCAHYVANTGITSNPSMRFTFKPLPTGNNIVVKITDNGGPGTDTLFAGLAGTGIVGGANALKWVNTGVLGSGNAANTFIPLPYTSGDFTITATP